MSLAQFEPKKIYIRVNAQPITTSGIYHNSELGLISLSSDGSNWITIADKNLGATTVWNNGDAINEANCGKYYQWGNNYGFAWTGTLSTSPALVNTNNYGPNNYYSSSTFITTTSSPYDWSSPQNNNLRGNTTDTLIARRGPCDEGWHIPTSTEIGNLVSLGISLGAWDSSGGDNFCNYIKVPYSGSRSSAGAVSAQGTRCRWRSSSINGTRSPYYRITSTQITAIDGARVLGHSIRPFKNEAVQPDDSRTKLY